jgi:glycosyltransferase involved in cell wall biosynthesis
VPDPGPPTPPGKGVVFVGRLRDEKGVALLLDAWSRHPDGALGPLTFVGDGPDAPLVRAAAAGRSDVVAAGQLDRDGVRTAIRSAAAVVVPSIWPEALPLIVLEAFANARPVIATNVGGLPAVVTPDVGWVVEPTVDALADALEWTADVGSRGKAARELYESTYSPHVVVKQLTEIYRDVSSARR